MFCRIEFCVYGSRGSLGIRAEFVASWNWLSPSSVNCNSYNCPVYFLHLLSNSFTVFTSAAFPPSMCIKSIDIDCRMLFLHWFFTYKKAYVKPKALGTLLLFYTLIFKKNYKFVFYDTYIIKYFVWWSIFHICIKTSLYEQYTFLSITHVYVEELTLIWLLTFFIIFVTFIKVIFRVY